MAVHVLIGLLLGLFVGVLIGGLDGAVGPGLVFGGLIGGLGGWAVSLSARVRRLEIEAELNAADTWRTKRAAATTAPRPPQKGPTAPAVEPAAASPASPAPTIAASGPNDDPVWAPEMPPQEPVERSVVSAGDRFVAVAKTWFTTGNVPVKVGVVVVLFGVAFFINYAIDRQLFSFPVWGRLAMVALLGAAMLAIGWRLRRTREVYALSLQGGGLGVLYLTTYAAFEFYALLPATVAFAAMVLVTVATGGLALVQNSRVLVVMGVAGGFLAPLLTATETGSHVVLFSYYAVLNAAILTIAWFKAWRSLNLLGFAFTFVIGSLWGYQGYRPEHFATTEPFLVLFVLMYIGIAVLFALRRPPNLRGFVDSALVFGTPLVGFTLQTLLVESEAGLAWTAGGMVALYAVLAGVLWRIRDLRLLAMSFAGLAILFLAVAFPLALDDRWTCTAWAVQAATLAWFGLRNGSRLLMFAGAGVHVAAVVAHVLAGLSETDVTPVANGPFVGGILLALSAWTIAWSFDHSELPFRVRAAFSGIALGWATVSWYATGAHEIVKFVDDLSRSAWLGFAGLSAIAAMLGARVVQWPRLNVVAPVLFPAMVVLALDVVVTQRHPLENLAWLAWPFAFGAQYVFLRYREAIYPTLAPFLHVGTYWVLAFLIASESRWLVGQVADGAWPLASAVVSAALFALATGALREKLSWPVGRHWDAYSTAGTRVVAGVAAVLVVAAGMTSTGSAAPLPYLPLLNPLTIGAVTAGIAVWYCFDAEARRRNSRVLGPLFSLVGLVVLSMEVARGVHHFAGVPFTTSALAGSAIFQAGLSLVWGTAGLAGMVIGAVRERRVVWIGGASVMGIVIVKLFVVELGNVGTLSRVVSFLGVGLLLLVVGYLAPVPKGRGEERGVA